LRFLPRRNPGDHRGEPRAGGGVTPHDTGNCAPARQSAI
jgi:hypothetical protein